MILYLQRKYFICNRHISLKKARFRVLFFCERVTKRSKIEVKVSKSSVAIKNIAYTPVLLLIL